MHRLSKVKIEWGPQFAYAIGLITTDGCLSKDGRHIDFTSKDRELVLKFKKCLRISNKIGIKFRGEDGYKKTKCFRVQLGDINFYEFLLSIGLGPKKSKNLHSLKIPNNYFIDFLRGCIDGDGTIGFFKHPESSHPQLRIRLYSGSLNFLEWVKNKIKENFKVDGGWIEIKPKSRITVLAYGKSDSVCILSHIYYDKAVFLERKYKIAKKFYGRVAELGIRA